MTPRQLALQILQDVIDQGYSLSTVSSKRLNQLSDPRDRALAYRLALDCLRRLNRYHWMRDQLLERPFKGRDNDIAMLITLGISQLSQTDLPAHASIHETVEVARHLKKKWAVSLTNGVLREFQRQQDTLNRQADDQPSLQFSHPTWFIEQVKKAWPNHWQTLLEANNCPAKLCLRLQPHIDRLHYLSQLTDGLLATPHPSLTQSILLNSTDITQLPGFEQGWFSVQDASAQWAGHLINPTANERILDACAAPGGKTTHLLEISQQQADITALDVDEQRLQRIQENLQRLSLHAHLQAADANQLDQWWDGQPFDAILLDAPCSATGIIRRHPDIKWHRKATDIQPLTDKQSELLDHLWLTLKPNGRMLYATCSVLPAENHLQIQHFLARTPKARLCPMQLPNALDTGHGVQLLPRDSDSGDGFFYALLHKQA